MKMHNIIHSKIIEDIRTECTANITLTPGASKRFFKTSKGSYAEEDEFLGVTVPNLRKIAKIYKNIELQIVEELLKSQYNEERLLALLILVEQYQKGDSDCQKEIYQFYLENLRYVNNWNLVDSSAYHILGHYLFDKNRSKIYHLAGSDILWERRIAIVATLYFIRKDDLSITYEISKILLKDKHDLIHKAVGWMLREAGKKDEASLISFLDEHASQMPKTMLRYSIERLSTGQKKEFQGPVSHLNEPIIERVSCS
jgi:3-methyladenine DNA glycosylase AlkD